MIIIIVWAFQEQKGVSLYIKKPQLLLKEEGVKCDKDAIST